MSGHEDLRLSEDAVPADLQEQAERAVAAHRLLGAGVAYTN